MPIFNLPAAIFNLATNSSSLPSDESTNYDVATNQVKITEAANKLGGGSGELSKFTNLSNGIALANNTGKIIALDSSTGEAISEPLDSVVGDVAIFDFDITSDRTAAQRVKISQMPELGALNVLELINMPTIQESRDVSYKGADIVHHPGEILKYQNTSSRVWQITAKLTSRNPAEATRNLDYINMIRAWAMPFYGNGTANEFSLNRLVGSPPPILTLAAYGKQMIGPVPCVLINYSWTFPNDCDYITTETGAPFPVILDINLTLKESFSPAEYSNFNLMDYKSGNMSSSFKGSRFSPANNVQKDAALVSAKESVAEEQSNTTFITTQANNVKQATSNSVVNFGKIKNGS